MGESQPFLDNGFEPDVWGYVIRYGLGAIALAVIVRLFLWRRSDFRIEVKGGKITYDGRIPLAIRPACSEFLLQDLGIQGPARIYAIRQKTGWRLWFSGHIGEGEKQRIRNFITTRLGSR